MVSRKKKLLDDPGVRQNVTGKGYDINGNAVFWVRIGDNFDLYKFDGKTFSIVSSGNTVGGFAHFGDIIKVNNNELICFWNDYATNRSYGIARSKDNGVTWDITKFDAETNNSEVPTETQGVYIGDGKILAIGRKDVSGSTAAQMQFQSDDNGSTWTKKYTNITDIYASTTSMIINNDTNEIYLHYYNRSNGKLLARHTKVSEVWNSPTNWPESEVIATGGVGQNAGNVNAVKFNGKHYISYYSGDDKNTGVYVVIRNE